MSHRTPLRGLRDSLSDSSDWRLSLEFLVPGSLPPSVVESYSVTVPPGFSLYQVSQMLEHGGSHPCRLHGVHLALYSPVSASETLTVPPSYDSASYEDTTLATVDATSHVATGNPIHDGSMLDLARTVSTHRLMSDEIQEIHQLATRIHQRLETSRAIFHRSDEYVRSSWLMTRAYMARVLEELSANPPDLAFGRPSDPSGSDEADLGLS